MTKKSKNNKKELGVPQEKGEALSKAIMSETQQAFVSAGFTPEAMAKEYALMGFSDPANHCEIAEGGELRFKTFEEQGDARRALKKIKEKTVITESKDGNQIYKTSTVEWEMHDKKGTLDTVVNIMGMKAPEKIELDATTNLADMMRVHLASKK